MSQFLKQSTAGTLIMFGPFVDKADGITLKTDATTITDIDHATTGIFISKNGIAAAIRHQNVTASVADAYGMMKVTLDATDTNAVGTLDVLFAKAATYLPVHKTFEVLPANVYDSLMGTDALQIDIIQVNGASQTATLDTIKTDTAAVKVMTDKIGTVTNTGGTATIGAILGDFANTTITGRHPTALTANGNMKSSLVEILTTALTETSGLLSAAFKKFFNVATPTGTVNSIPDAVAGAANGLQIAGSNAAATYASLSVTGTLGVGATTLASLTCTGALTTGSKVNNGVLTQTGAVSLGSTLGVTGTTTLTGAVSAPAGIAANITGNLTGTVSTVAAVTGLTASNLDAKVSDVKTMTDKIGTVANTGGLATIGAILGDFANTTLKSSMDVVNGDHGLVSIQDDIDSILADTNEIQAELVDGGRLDLIIDATATSASEANAHAHAIDLQTAKLVFTVANELDANVQSVNGTALTGNGSALTPWGPV